MYEKHTARVPVARRPDLSGVPNSMRWQLQDEHYGSNSQPSHDESRSTAVFHTASQVLYFSALELRS